jgi:hypothetical protein
MLQAVEGMASRFSAWIASDPQHSEIWLGIGLALAIGCIALLSFDQLKTRAAEQR